jgi:hypothetical protein
MENELNTEVGIKEFPIHTKNPYMPNLIIPQRNKIVQAVSGDGWSLINTETGEEKGLLLAIKQKVDKEEFVKIYRSQIQLLFNLSSSAIKVFGYIMESLEINKDLIILDIKEVCRYTGYKTRATIYKALIELLENKFIARTSKPNVYFINPAIFFNGNRIVLVKEYMKDDSIRDKRNFSNLENSEYEEISSDNENRE